MFKLLAKRRVRIAAEPKIYRKSQEVLNFKQMPAKAVPPLIKEEPNV
jgi:hypothetical protein